MFAGVSAQVKRKKAAATQARRVSVNEKVEDDHKAATGRNEKALYSTFWVGVRNMMHIQMSSSVKERINKNRKLWSVTNSVDEIRLAQTSLFSPHSALKISFNVITGLLVIYTLIAVPFRVAFSSGLIIPALDYIDYFVDCVFGAEIIINFNTAELDSKSDHLFIIDRAYIARKYLKFWFWIDLASTVPLGDIALAFIGNKQTSLLSLRLIRIIRLTKSVKLFRFLKLIRLSKQFSILETSPALTSVITLAFQVMILAHVIGCYWYFLTTSEVVGDSGVGTWIELVSDIEESDTFGCYIASLYWTFVTMLSIGYGDIHAVSTVERIYSVMVMLTGGLMFGAVIAQMVRLIEARNPQQREFKMKMTELRGYLSTKKRLTAELKKRAVVAYAYFLKQKIGMGDAGEFLHQLPTELFHSLVQSIYAYELARVDLFQTADMTFVSAILSKCKPFEVSKGDKIYEIGDVAEEMFFLTNGLVRFVVSIGRRRVITGYAREGGYFGDFEFVGKTVRTLTTIAASNCTLLAISFAALEGVIDEHFAQGQALLKEMKTRCDKHTEVTRQPLITLEECLEARVAGHMGRMARLTKKFGAPVPQKNQANDIELLQNLQQPLERRPSGRRGSFMFAAANMRSNSKTNIHDDTVSKKETPNTSNKGGATPATQIPNFGGLLQRTNTQIFPLLEESATSERDNVAGSAAESDRRLSQRRISMDMLGLRRSSTSGPSVTEGAPLLSEEVRASVDIVAVIRRLSGGSATLPTEMDSEHLAAPQSLDASVLQAESNREAISDSRVSESSDSESGGISAAVSGKEDNSIGLSEHSPILKSTTSRELAELTENSPVVPTPPLKSLNRPDSPAFAQSPKSICSSAQRSARGLPLPLADKSSHNTPNRSSRNDNASNRSGEDMLDEDANTKIKKKKLSELMGNGEQDASSKKSPVNSNISHPQQVWVNGDLRLSRNPLAITDDFDDLLKLKEVEALFRLQVPDEQKQPTIVEASIDSLWGRYILHPMGPNKQLWDISLTAFVMQTLLVIPMQIAYGTDGFGQGYIVYDNIVDLLFFVDMCLSARTAFFSELENAYVTIPERIYQNYTKNWMLIDICCCVPFDELLLLICDDESISASVVHSSLVDYLRFARVLKLARMFKATRFFHFLEEDFGVPPILLSLLKMLTELIFMAHILACLWWIICISANPQTGWMNIGFGDVKTAAFGDQYTTSLYWAVVTLSTTGYGDIAPTNTAERIVNLVYIIIAVPLFGYVLANAATRIGNLNHASMLRQERLSQITEFLKEKKCPRNIERAIVRHFSRQFKTQSVFAEDEILENLPRSISNEILWHEHLDVMSRLKIFDYIENKTIALHIFKAMTPAFYSPDQYIIKAHEPPRNIYFFYSGKGKVYKCIKSNAADITATKKRNSIAGDKKSLASGVVSILHSMPALFRSRKSRLKNERTAFPSHAAGGTVNTVERKDSLTRIASVMSFGSLVPQKPFNQQDIRTYDGEDDFDEDGTESKRRGRVGIFASLNEQQLRKTGRVVMREVGEGDLIGYAALMRGIEEHESTVRAMTDCHVYVLRRSAILRLLRDMPSVAVLLQSALGQVMYVQNRRFGHEKILHLQSKLLGYAKNKFTKLVKKRKMMMMNSVDESLDGRRNGLKSIRRSARKVAVSSEKLSERLSLNWEKSSFKISSQRRSSIKSTASSEESPSINKGVSIVGKKLSSRIFPVSSRISEGDSASISSLIGYKDNEANHKAMDKGEISPLNSPRKTSISSANGSALAAHVLLQRKLWDGGNRDEDAQSIMSVKRAGSVVDDDGEFIRTNLDNLLRVMPGVDWDNSDSDKELEYGGENKFPGTKTGFSAGETRPRATNGVSAGGAGDKKEANGNKNRLMRKRTARRDHLRGLGLDEIPAILPLDPIAQFKRKRRQSFPSLDNIDWIYETKNFSVVI